MDVLLDISFRAVFVKFQQGGSADWEARRAESGGGVLGKGAASPLPTS